MQLGMIGLGRMGSNMVRRLVGAGPPCVVFDMHLPAAVELAKAGAVAKRSLAELISKREPPRVVWIMVPAAAVEATLGELTPLFAPGDTAIDGGDSYHHDDIRRAKTLGQSGIHDVDVGTSAGVWGFERGYCLMIGGDPAAVRRLDAIFAALAPGLDAAAKTPGEGKATPPRGYIHCGPPGAGHFVKMVHNGIEYGIMAAYAEGLNILRPANAGKQAKSAADAETAPLGHPEHYPYDLNLADIAETWRHGSVIASWLLDLTAAAVKKSADLNAFAGEREPCRGRADAPSDPRVARRERREDRPRSVHPLRRIRESGKRRGAAGL